jgi:hypothetical protein
LRWSLVSSTAHLDPARFLGELADLPATARPGDWCTVVIVDELGEVRWTLVALEVERTSSLFVGRRPSGPLGDELGPAFGPVAERVAERQGADGSDSSARVVEGGADRPAAVSVRGRR